MLGINGFKYKKNLLSAIGTKPRFIETSFFGPEYNGDGEYAVVGPDVRTRKWFALVTIKNGVISRVD